MTKNLDVDRFRNGDKIPEETTMNDWLKAYMEKKLLGVTMLIKQHVIIPMKVIKCLESYIITLQL